MKVECGIIVSVNNPHPISVGRHDMVHSSKIAFKKPQDGEMQYVTGRGRQNINDVRSQASNELQVGRYFDESNTEHMPSMCPVCA